MRKILFSLLTLSLACHQLGAASFTPDSLSLAPGICSSLEEMMEGAVSGVSIRSTDGNVATQREVNIRGINSVYGNGQPLWVVDGMALTSTSGQQVNAFWSDKYAGYSNMPQLSQLQHLNLYDISSIEVLKNVSAAADYGYRGANGVIVITTRMPEQNRLQVRWNSNAGVQIPEYGSSLTGAGFSHNHNVSVAYTANRASYWLSAFYKDVQSGIPGSDARFGGLRLKFDSKTNDLIWVGINFNTSIGRQSAATACGEFGLPDMGLTLRGIEIPGKINSFDGWKNDYDDYSSLFRATADAYVQMNFLPVLKWRTKIGIDSNNATRYLWAGLGTQFGKEFNRAQAIAGSTILGYNAETSLTFDRSVAAKHRIKASIAAEINGENSSFNNMASDNYFTDILREKGYNLKESSIPPFRTGKEFLDLGAYARVFYDFSGIFELNAFVRIDRNFRYDDDFTVYPSVALGLDLRRAFFPESRAVSALKINAGYGKAGRRQYSPWRLLGNYSIAPYVLKVLADKNMEIDENEPTKNIAAYFDIITRTVSSEWNVSVHAGFADKVDFTLGFYDKSSEERFELYCFGRPKKGDKPYLWEPVPRMAVLEGASQDRPETASFRNRGVELQSEIVPVRTSSTSLSLSLEGAYNWSTAVTGYAWNPVPAFNGGLSANLKAGRFNAAARFDSSAGFEICDMNAMLSDKVEEISDKYICKGDWFRLSRLEAGYSVPLGIKWVKEFRVSLGIANVFTVSSYPGWNPCAGTADYGILPQARTVMAGLSVKF